MSEHWLVTYSKRVNEDLKSIQVHLVDDPEQNAFINDLVNYPHAFVLACFMDRRVKAEIAWSIPYKIRNYFEENFHADFSIDELASHDLEWYTWLFNDKDLHRHNDTMAEVFYKAVIRIKERYDGDASKIWSGCPSSAIVVFRFLEFEGVGVKIATMAANILHRQFGIEYSDYSSIDVSPDVHVRRIFYRAGLAERGTTKETIIYKARDLNPTYPGIVDAACWRLGRSYCREENPDCEHCPVSKDCPKIV